VLSRLKSRLLHHPMNVATFSDRRTSLIAVTQGRVLELCFETNKNLPYYSPWVTELAQVCLAGAEAQPRETTTERGLRVRRVFRDPTAAQLPFEDSRFDWAVSTLALCRMRHPAALLTETARVLKPSGAYLFLEHGRSSDPATSEWQDRLDRYWGRIGGCELCLPIDDIIRSVGFRIDLLERFQLGRPKFLSAMYRGSATKAPS
jgi:SAM-dependent methyltransferase